MAGTLSLVLANVPWAEDEGESGPAPVPTAPESGGAADTVGDAACLACHEALREGFAAAYGETRHAKLFTEANALTPLMRDGCEACHGPGSAHVEAGGGRGIGELTSFAGNAPEDVEQQNRTCLRCHSGGGRRFWAGSVHHTRDVSCTSCHQVMHNVSERNLLSKRTQAATCAGCHPIQNARQYRNAHMPLRPGAFQSSSAADGKMVCSSCHNVHGTISEKLIAHVSVNANCLSCHAEKRGPFLWEHPPVSEDCLNCHDPHGSTRGKMLKLGVPRLCQSCHNSRFHPSTPRTSTDRFVLGSSCLQCHPNIHGSNHPSGFAFTR